MSHDPFRLGTLPRDEEAGTAGRPGGSHHQHHAAALPSTLWARSPPIQSLTTTTQATFKKHNPELDSLMKTQVSPCHCKVTTLQRHPLFPGEGSPSFCACLPEASAVWPCRFSTLSWSCPRPLGAEDGEGTSPSPLLSALLSRGPAPWPPSIRFTFPLSLSSDIRSVRGSP